MNAVVSQVIVPLAEWAKLRRPAENKAACSWVREAKAFKIPGAFQFAGKGPWYVNLDTYDREVQKLSAPKVETSTEDLIAAMAKKLGLNCDEMKLALQAGRT